MGIMRIPLVTLSGALLAAIFDPRPASACGVTAGGTAGLTSCSLEEHNEAIRRRWHLGSSYSFSATGLRFAGEQDFVQERHASLVTLEFRPVRRGTVLVGAGAFLGGHLRTATAKFDFAPGFVGVAGGSWRLVEGGRYRPFVLVTAQLSYARAESLGAAYNAFDLRGGVVAATTFWRFLTPYALARAFGGPVYWRYQGQDVVGTDTHHYQLGGGLAVLVRERVDLFAEGIPLGERGLVAGAGLSF
jgi:hypothetical protein